MIIFLLTLFQLQAETLRTNETLMNNAPSWLTTTRVEKVTQNIQHKLEWSTRRVNVTWYNTKEAFQQAHSLGANAIAVTKYTGGDASVHIGPAVNTNNFDAIFGHELVHVIVFQKYKSAIPKWIEEGLANHLANLGAINYQWLASQPKVKDVRELAHPMSGTTEGISYRYKASQAVAEMLEKKCDLDNLIRLSVERKMEDYIASYCQIKDLNQAFNDWVQSKALKK